MNKTQLIKRIIRNSDKIIIMPSYVSNGFFVIYKSRYPDEYSLFVEHSKNKIVEKPDSYFEDIFDNNLKYDFTPTMTELFIERGGDKLRYVIWEKDIFYKEDYLNLVNQAKSEKFALYNGSMCVYWRDFYIIMPFTVPEFGCSIGLK